MPYPKSLFLKLAFIFFLVTNSTFSTTLNKHLKVNSSLLNFQDSISHTEKVYLHFDKSYYSSGEMMWFKTYLVSANTNRPDAKSSIVHVELIDPMNKIINSRIIKISQGGGDGEFYLPKRLSSGEYTVRAYTNFMRNFDASYFFAKKINIRSQYPLTGDKIKFAKKSSKSNLKNTPSKLKPDLQFFPEGGYLVANKTSNVGFKAIGPDGKSISITGAILDSNNEEVLNFKTQKFGLGKFELTPTKDELYKAVINYNDSRYTYEIPIALEKGVTMEVIERENEYHVILRSSLPRGVHRLTLTGLQNGKVIAVSQLTGAYKSGLIKVSKDFLKQGIAQFTISDKKGKPLCERLIFIETNFLKPKASISSVKNQHSKRELIELNIDLNTMKHANLSLAVTDISVVNKEEYGLDIKSHLLLNSELKGEIEQPGYYFDIKNDDRKQLLDVLMMTQGWRQFLWDHANENEIQRNNKEYAHETGIRMKGIVKNKYGKKKSASAEVSLVYMNKNEFVEDKMKSSNNGRFIFGDYHFNDSTSVIIQAKNYKIKKRKKKKDRKKLIMNYSILLDTFSPHTILTRPSFSYNEDNSNKFVTNDYMIRSKMARLSAVIPFDIEDAEQLDEAIVTGYVRPKIKEKFKNRLSIYNNPTYRVDMDDIESFSSTNALVALQGKIPGLRVVTDGFNITNISLRGASFSLSGRSYPPLILLNNFPTDLAAISTILIEDVSFVDILTSTGSAIFGSRALGGVISIYTKRGNERAAEYKKNRRGIINFTHPGYYKARKFYEPNYSVQKPEHKKFDYRTTIYWKPTIISNNTKKTKISFYAADIPTTYRIDLQGISKNGIPIKSEMYVDVE